MASVKTFLDWEGQPRCTLCGANSGLERHHKIYRSRGGDDTDANLVLLCRVCHAASHGLAVNFNGHCCETCKILKIDGCYWGERLLGQEIKTPPPWEER